MHYRHNDFLSGGASQKRDASTIVPHEHSIRKGILGSSDEATYLDFLHLNVLYCGGTNDKLLYCCAFRLAFYILHEILY